MARRSTPERLDVARRAATIERLVSDGMLRDAATAAVAAWEARTAQDGRARSSDDWDAAYREIAAKGA
jgi:hypothetical protein